MKKIAVVLAFVLCAASLLAGQGKACDHSAKSTTASAEKSCAHEKGAAHAKNASCDMKDAKNVQLTGKILCKHCNLHQQETCEKVFQASNDEKTLYSLCKGSKVDVAKVSEEGKATLKIKGKLVKCGAHGGGQELMIEEASKI